MGILLCQGKSSVSSDAGITNVVVLKFVELYICSLEEEFMNSQIHSLVSSKINELNK